MKLYIIKKNCWIDQVFYSVNWEASRRAQNKIKSLVKQRFIIKWCHNLVPTAYIKHKRKEACLDTCPTYKTTIETNEQWYYAPMKPDNNGE